MTDLDTPAVSHPHAARVDRHWRWPVVAALLATIPAFYAELLDASPALWCRFIYLVAACTLGAAVLHEAWRRGHLLRHLAAHAVDLLLVAGLATAALGPASSQSSGVGALRLMVAFLTLARMSWTLRHWVSRGGVLHLMGIACFVLALCGGGFWWLEPRVHSLADGLWLAFTTAATVGYGDIVPSTPASRIFSVFVVLLGYGMLSLVTAAIATTWVETKERLIEREILRDVHKQLDELHGELRELRGELRDAEND